MRNPDKNYGLLNSEGLFCLIKSGWLAFASLGLDLHLRANRASLVQYEDCLFEQRYSFVVVHPNELKPSGPSPSKTEPIQPEIRERNAAVVLEDSA